MPLKRSQSLWTSLRPYLGSFPWRRRLALPLLLGGVVTSISAERALPAEPPSPALDIEMLSVEDDIPEEILRTEIITGARSPLTGEVLSAAEYAQLQATLAAPAGDPLVSDDLRYLVFLLQFRRAVRPVFPFL